IERINAPACARLSRGGSLDQQVDRDVIFQSADVRPRGGGLGQRTHYFAAGQVLRVKHAAMAMPTLPAQVVLLFAVVLAAGLNPGEASAEPDQFAHRLGTLANYGLDRGAIAQAGARPQRVLDVRFERVVNAPHAGDAALRIGGVGLGTAGLGENGDSAG